MTVTFFGHRDTPQNIEPRLLEVLRHLIENESADLFYVGNQGAFDRIVKSSLEELKIEYPHISCYIILAYMPTKKNNDIPSTIETIYPDGLEKVPRRFAISQRNKWMLTQSDTVITYVEYRSSGAGQFKELAEKKGKRIIELCTENLPTNIK